MPDLQSFMSSNIQLQLQLHHVTYIASNDRSAHAAHDKRTEQLCNGVTGAMLHVNTNRYCRAISWVLATRPMHALQCKLFHMLQMCGSSSWIIPAGLSLPYAWRLCQCIRTWKDTGNKAQLLNALKYSTAFPVIILSAVNFQVTDESWEQFWKPLWLLAAFLNSAYSYYWDIERDWEIQYFSSASGRPSA